MFTQNKAVPEEKLIKRLTLEAERVERVQQALLAQKSRVSYFCTPEKIHEVEISQIEADCVNLTKAKEGLEAKVQEIKEELERQSRIVRLFEELKIDIYKLILDMGGAFHAYLKEFSKKNTSTFKPQVEYYLAFAFNQIFGAFFENNGVDKLGLPDNRPKKSMRFTDKTLKEIKKIVDGVYDKCVGSVNKLNIDLMKVVDDKKAQDEIRAQIQTAARKAMDVFSAGLQKLTDTFDSYFKLKEKMSVVQDLRNHPIFNISEDIVLNVPDCTELFRRNDRLLQSVEEYTRELKATFDDSVEEAEKLFNRINYQASQYQLDCKQAQEDLETTITELKLQLESKRSTFDEKNKADEAYQQAICQSTKLLKSGLHHRLRVEFQRGRELYQGVNFTLESEKKCIDPILKSFDELNKASRRASNILSSSQDFQTNLVAHRKEVLARENESAIKLFLKFLDEELFSPENLNGFLHNQTSTFCCLGGIKIRVGKNYIRVPTGIGLMAKELKNHDIDQLTHADAKKFLQVTLHGLGFERKKFTRGRSSATDQILNAILSITNNEFLLMKDVEEFERVIKNISGVDNNKLIIGNAHKERRTTEVEHIRIVMS